MPLDDFTDLLSTASHRAGGFVNSHIVPLYGNENSLSLDKLIGKLQDRLYTVGGMAYKAAEAGEWQTYNAHVKSISDINKLFKSKNFSKKAIGFAKDAMVDPEGAVTSRLVESSRSYLSKAALHMAEAKEVEKAKVLLPVDSEKYSEIELRKNSLKAEQLKERLLGLEALGYTKGMLPLGEWIDNKGWNKNMDPLEAALNIGKSEVKRQSEDEFFGRKTFNTDERIGGIRQRQNEAARNYKSMDSFRFSASIFELLKEGPDVFNMSVKERERYLNRIEALRTGPIIKPVFDLIPKNVGDRRKQFELMYKPR